MSLTLIGALTGFLGSAVPEITGIFKKRGENKHNLDVMKLQIAAKKNDVDLDLKSFREKKTYIEHKNLLDHDSSMSSEKGFFGGLRKSVRPMITYFFFALFMAIKITHIVMVVSTQEDFGIVQLNVALNSVWDENTEAMFAAIVAFWFGSRVFEKRK